ncbi:putative GPI-anchored cell surface glycoprotein [Aspergillus bombycis]|uniref:Putative GPI-anchored cell surface glycoprotein n=1 Tax=Aspergillus bombycis TaxID=109264 RepID=A0A1F7ZPV1_9EURO|nr:putative GPI-anchored cell surface glycoprotein [Aspergillus bombycis]OGM41484.1 putative GPI-anchored cell surface glycoprotein [Aspergillus bombycis]
MSLNGLDNPAVIEAYQTALSEAGGWFLLQYVSRDEVALLDRGTGGVPDVRNAIDGYEEKSPLYGFLQYRRRKVVLSYLPEGISRLVQARTTVQFQSILDKFSPHDTVFSLSQPSELTESALSSACLLHTASGSITSSSNSLRRRRLMEIAEDAEETPGSKDASPAPVSTKDFRQRSFSQLSEATIVASPVASDAHSIRHGTETSSSTKTPDDTQANDRPPSIAGDHDSERPASRKTSRDELSYSEPRRSSQSARPSLKDLERTGVYKPKVKLGPRPSVDESGRPRTAGNLSRSAEQRPVASLPAGMRSSSLRRSNPSPARPRSQGSTVASMSGRTVPPVPPLLVPPLSMPISRPQLSPGAKSLSALSSSGTSQERERLMKALQLRKTQMEKKAQEGKKIHQDVGERKEPQFDPIEDKENISHAHDHMKRVQADENKSSVLEHSKGPLSETQPTVVPEPVEVHDEHIKAVSDTVISESTPDMSITDLRDISETSEENKDDAKEFPNTGHCQAASVLEDDVADEDLTKSIDEETKSGPGSPSAAKEVPLEERSLNIPDEEIAVRSPPAESPLAPVERETDAIGEPAESALPQSIPVLSTPDSRTSYTSYSPTTHDTHVTETQNDLTPEVLVTEQKDIDTRKEKRRPHLEPIQVPTPDYSDDDNLSDDSFMEELKSATLEEAKPISVGNSPLSPGYSNNGNDRSPPDAWKNSRAVSNPSAIGRQPLNIHALAVGRSVSTPYNEADSSVLVAKKINVSSGISKRIAALEKFSSRGDAQPSSNQTLAAPSSASFEALRKRASVSLNGNSDSAPGSRHGSFTPESFSRASSVRRPDSQSSASVKRTNSVSVTARIIRDSNTTPGDSKADPSENSVLDLQASPLIVEHTTCDSPSSDPSPEPMASESKERSMSTSSVGSSNQPPAPSMPRSDSRMSVSSSSKTEDASKPVVDAPSSPEGKKESRASRLLRRMSSITSTSRKSPFSSLGPVVKESTPLDTGVEIPQAVDIGEVNVQFPDTLLWKRRFVRVDDKGYLVLTPGNIDSSNRNMVKRYHLSEFRTPALPDEDRQELPNSILLDFLDGSTLQCACESRQGQAFVLRTLVDAHNAHQQLSQ